MGRLKNIIITTIAAASICIAGMGYGGSIRGSKHDLSSSGGILDRSVNTEQVCIFCHTPHNADRTVPGAQLWNKKLSDTVYELYSSDTMHSTPHQPSGADKLCLSCHDGTVAVNQLYNNPEETGNQPPTMGYGNELSIDGKIKSGANLTDVLSDDHPTSMQYPHYGNPHFSGTPNDELIDPVDEKGSGLDPLLLRSGEMKCVSCHDPHDDTRALFLRKDNAGANLCMTCHEEKDYDLSSHKYPDSVNMQENCMECHKTHAAEPNNYKLTKMPDEQLCFDCHTASGKASTDVEDDFKGTAKGTRFNAKLNTHHDVSDADQVYSGAKVTCAVCHDPHAANNNKKTIADPDPNDGRMPTNMEEFCLDCHDNSFPSKVTPPTYPLENIYDDWDKSEHKDEGKTCSDCHDLGHGTTNIAQLKTVIDGKLVEVTDISPENTNSATNGRDWCNSCHGSEEQHEGTGKQSDCLKCHGHGKKF